LTTDPNDLAPAAPAASSPAPAETSTTPDPGAVPADPPAPATSTPPATSSPSSSALGVGKVCAYTYPDPYNDGEPVTQFGLVLEHIPADPADEDSVDRIRVAWLPPGEAVLPASALSTP
jgi:hypothetical protein